MGVGGCGGEEARGEEGTGARAREWRGGGGREPQSSKSSSHGDGVRGESESERERERERRVLRGLCCVWDGDRFGGGSWAHIKPNRGP